MSLTDDDLNRVFDENQNIINREWLKANRKPRLFTRKFPAQRSRRAALPPRDVMYHIDDVAANYALDQFDRIRKKRRFNRRNPFWKSSIPESILGYHTKRSRYEQRKQNRSAKIIQKAWERKKMPWWNKAFDKERLDWNKTFPYAYIPKKYKPGSHQFLQFKNNIYKNPKNQWFIDMDYWYGPKALKIQHMWRRKKFKGYY